MTNNGGEIKQSKGFASRSTCQSLDKHPLDLAINVKKTNKS